MSTTATYAAACMLCHRCGGPIRTVLDGEEWCQSCERYQRPYSHGWVRSPYADEYDRLPCSAVKARPPEDAHVASDR